MMKIEATIYPYANGGNLKAFADIVIDEGFVVKSLRVMDGKNGLFVSFPSRKTADGEYVDTAYPITAEARKQIVNTVIDEYKDGIK